MACVMLLSTSAFALDPALDISQYAHTAWRISDGFPATPITSFAQTQDGYLWLGTAEQGLMRFDGVRSTPWQPPQGASLPNNRIVSLLTSRDGTLWIGTGGGLASWDGRELRNYPQFNGGPVYAMIQDREGTVWAGGALETKGLLCAIRNAGTECDGADGKFGTGIGSLYEDKKGTLWLSASNGLWRWNLGPQKLYPLADLSFSVEGLSETGSGAILLATLNGMRQLSGDKLEPFLLPTMPGGPRPSQLFRDRDGGLWIGTGDGGLLHAHGDRVDGFSRSDGLSGDDTTKIFEDREGDIWIATNEGLDRFRALPAVTYTARQGLSGIVTSVATDKDGSVWLGTTVGLYRWRDGRLFAYRARDDRSPARNSPASGQPPVVSEVLIEGLPKPGVGLSLFEDSHGRIWLGSQTGLGYLENGRFVSANGVPGGLIDSITEDKQGNLWVAHRDAGLLRVSRDLEVQWVPRPSGARAGDGWRVATDPVDGGIWVGYFSGLVVHMFDGAVRASYSAGDGLGKGAVTGVRVGADGAVWAATQGGLSRIRAGRIATLDANRGLPCDSLISSIEDDEGSTWIYATCGLVRIARADLDAWIAAVDQGKAPPTIRTTVLGNGDGVRSSPPPGGSFTPHLAAARDGRLWFATRDGVTSVDPRHLPFNALPPPVRVEQVVADRKTYEPSAQLGLPPLVRDLTIDYTALSLVAPEKILFRYKLEGRDRDWEDAGNRRQAFYTDLPPGDYRFRVIAANNSGVWNEDGAALAFSIAPAYWQTNWFLALCATAFAALVASAYRLRVRQIARARATEMEMAHANRLAVMGQLTASIAHEVNQPLGAAITNAQAGLRWLKAQPPNLDEVKQAFEEVVRAGGRAADVVASVRRMAKKAPAAAEDVSINAKIENILAITHGEAAKHGVSVRTELAPELPPVKGDRVELQQVVLNLVMNAIEAMSTLKDGPRELTIRSEADGEGGVVVSVSDTGPGLDTAALEKIFQAFYTTKESGLGMGLSICRAIIESYGGKLWAAANSPRGAVFQFTLPATRPD
jgi:signal transduction histidine kinase/ligand-binding sensor domain-containing protein